MGKSFNKKQLAARAVDLDSVKDDLFTAADAKEAVMACIRGKSDRDILWIIADIAMLCANGFVTISQCCGEFTLQINYNKYRFYL